MKHKEIYYKSKISRASSDFPFDYPAGRSLEGLAFSVRNGIWCFKDVLDIFQKKYYLERECVKMMHSLCASCAGE